MKIPTSGQLARVLLLIVIVPIVAIVPFVVLYGSVYILDPQELKMAMKLTLFGLWSLMCIGIGSWLTHRRIEGLSPLPGFDANEMFNWLRTGKSAPDDGSDQSPAEPSGSSFQL